MSAVAVVTLDTSCKKTSCLVFGREGGALQTTALPNTEPPTEPPTEHPTNPPTTPDTEPPSNPATDPPTTSPPIDPPIEPESEPAAYAPRTWVQRRGCCVYEQAESAVSEAIRSPNKDACKQACVGVGWHGNFDIIFGGLCPSQRYATCTPSAPGDMPYRMLIRACNRLLCPIVRHGRRCLSVSFDKLGRLCTMTAVMSIGITSCHKMVCIEHQPAR